MLIAMSPMAWSAPLNDKVTEVLENYCFDCHAEGIKKGGFDMDVVFEKKDFDGALMFENVINAKMPPADEDQPTAEEKAIILNWLAKHQPEKAHDSYRRISRHEFTHSLNDLLPKIAAPTTSTRTAASNSAVRCSPPTSLWRTARLRMPFPPKAIRMSKCG